jgi:hypothetical protein
MLQRLRRQPARRARASQILSPRHAGRATLAVGTDLAALVRNAGGRSLPVAIRCSRPGDLSGHFR